MQSFPITLTQSWERLKWASGLDFFLWNLGRKRWLLRMIISYDLKSSVFVNGGFSVAICHGLIHYLSISRQCFLVDRCNICLSQPSCWCLVSFSVVLFSGVVWSFSELSPWFGRIKFVNGESVISRFWLFHLRFDDWIQTMFFGWSM